MNVRDNSLLVVFSLGGLFAGAVLMYFVGGLRQVAYVLAGGAALFWLWSWIKDRYGGQGVRNTLNRAHRP